MSEIKRYFVDTDSVSGTYDTEDKNGSMCKYVNVEPIIKRNAELEAELARLREQKPVWYYVESEESDECMMFQTLDKAKYHHEGLIQGREDDDTDDIKIIPLYSQPKPPELPDVDALAEFMQSIDSGDECHSYPERAKHICEWLKNGGKS